MLKPIISGNELINIHGNDDLIIIDSRVSAISNYSISHLAEALMVDINTDLAEIGNFKNGGRHPLPTVKHFVKVLNRLGISTSSHVVIYDENTGAFASRMWWMLRSIGHENVQVLDGGFDAALKLGYPMQTAPTKAKKPSNYKVSNWSWPTIEMEEVEKASKNVKKVVIDVRESHRYLGIEEPIDLIAGHIPNAINIPYTENLNEENLFLSKKELTKKYAKYKQNYSEIIFHCGSGVTACHSILALELCGFTTPTLYVGSWSEWSRNKKPMITNE